MARSGRGSREKGAGFERRCARLMGEWVGLPFHRVPASGGLRWKKTDNTTGDLISDKPIPVSIECKNNESWSWTNILNGKPNSAFTKWWTQCRDDAHRAHKAPLLLFTKNLESIWAAFVPESAPFYSYIQLQSGVIIVRFDELRAFDWDKFLWIIGKGLLDSSSEQ